MNYSAICLTVCAALLAGGNAGATVYDLVIPSIDGAQHGTPSPATGSGVMTYDDVTNEITWVISWSGLTGPQQILAFHGPAIPGERGEGQVNIEEISGLGNPTSGTTVVTPEQGLEILAGLWYFDIHTAQYPQGEIRGQVYVDTDSDGLADVQDNCIEIGNGDQRDTDGDNIGNACDADLSQDCLVNGPDRNLFIQAFQTQDDNADFNGDGFVNFADFGILRETIFTPPGPSGLPNLCDGGVRQRSTPVNAESTSAGAIEWMPFQGYGMDSVGCSLHD